MASEVPEWQLPTTPPPGYFNPPTALASLAHDAHDLYARPAPRSAPTLAFSQPPRLGSPRSSGGRTVGGSAAAPPPPLTSTTVEPVRCGLHPGLSEALCPVLLLSLSLARSCLAQAAVLAPTAKAPRVQRRADAAPPLPPLVHMKLT